MHRNVNKAPSQYLSIKKLLGPRNGQIFITGNRNARGSHHHTQNFQSLGKSHNIALKKRVDNITLEKANLGDDFSDRHQKQAFEAFLHVMRISNLYLSAVALKHSRFSSM